MSLAYFSIVQALDIWSELEKAYRGTNNYGGDICDERPTKNGKP